MMGWIAIMVILLAGAGIVHLISIPVRWWERIALSWLVGCPVVTLWLFCWSAYGAWVVLYAVVSLAVLRYLTFVPPQLTGGPRVGDLPAGWVSKISPVLWVLIAVQLLYAVITLFTITTHYWDAIHFWHLKARFFTVTGSLGTPDDPSWFLGGIKHHYPLHLPILKAFVCTSAGGWSERWALGIDLISFSAFLVMIWQWFADHHGQVAGLLAMFLIVSAPILVVHLTAGYGDLSVAVYLAAAAMSWDRWRCGGHRAWCVVAALLIAAAGWTKNDAIVLYVPLFLVACAWVGRTRGMWAFASTCAVLLVPWMAFKLSHDFSYTPNPGEPLVEFHPEGVFLLDDQFFKSGGFSIIWYCMFPLLLVWNRQHPSIAMWTLGLGCLCAVAATFLLTPAFEFLRNNMTFQRSLLQVFPLLCIAGVARLCDILNDHARNHVNTTG
jgi:hypothetical protein